MDSWKAWKQKNVSGYANTDTGGTKTDTGSTTGTDSWELWKRNNVSGYSNAADTTAEYERPWEYESKLSKLETPTSGFSWNTESADKSWLDGTDTALKDSTLKQWSTDLDTGRSSLESGGDWDKYLQAAADDYKYYLGLYDYKATESNWKKKQEAESAYNDAMAAYDDARAAWDSAADYYNQTYKTVYPEVGWAESVGSYADKGKYQVTADYDTLLDKSVSAASEDEAEFYASLLAGSLDYGNTADVLSKKQALWAEIEKLENKKQADADMALVASDQGWAYSPEDNSARIQKLKGTANAISYYEQQYQQEQLYGDVTSGETARAKVKELDGQIARLQAQADAGVKAAASETERYKAAEDRLVRANTGDSSIYTDESGYSREDDLAFLERTDTKTGDVDELRSQISALEQQRNLVERMGRAYDATAMYESTDEGVRTLLDKAADIYEPDVDENIFKEGSGWETGYSKKFKNAVKAVADAAGWDEATALKNVQLAYTYKAAKDEKELYDRVKQKSEDDKLYPLLSTAGSWIADTFSGAGAANIRRQIRLGRDYIETGAGTANKLGKWAQTVQSVTTERKQQRNPGTVGEADAWLYQTVNSTMENVVRLGLTLAGGAAIKGAAAVSGLASTAEAAAAAQTAGNILSNVLMSQSVAASEMRSMIEQGYDTDTAVTVGLVRGGIEALTEYASVERVLTALDEKAVWDRLLKSFLAEGGEEVEANYLNRIADRVFFGSKGAVADAVNEYKARGMTEKQALTQALTDVIGEDVSSFLAGGLSGLLLSGTSEAWNAIGNAKTAKSAMTSAVYNELTMSVTARPEAMSSDTVAQWSNPGYGTASVTGDAEHGYKVTVLDADGKTVATESVSAKSDSALEKACAKAARLTVSRLADKGTKRAARKVVGTENSELDIKDAERFVQFSNGVNAANPGRTVQTQLSQEIYEAANAEDAKTEDRLTQAEAIKVANVINAVVSGEMGATTVNARAIVKTLNLTENTTVRRIFAEKTGMALRGVAINAANAENLVLLTLADMRDARRAEAVVKAENQLDAAAADAEAARSAKLAEAFRAKQADIAPKVESAMRSGVQAAAQQSMPKLDSSTNAVILDGEVLTKEEFLQSDLARAVSQTADPGTFFDLWLAGEQGAGRAVQKNEDGTVRGKPGAYFDGKMPRLTARQKAAVRVLDELGKKYGFNFRIFASPVNERGEHTGDNGSYNSKTNVISVDLYAGSLDGRGTMLYTAAHELVHLMADLSEEDYNELLNTVTAKYNKDGLSFNERVQRQIDRRERLRDSFRAKYANDPDTLEQQLRMYPSLSRTAAEEEVIADSMEQMLAEKDVLNELLELEGVNKDFADKARAALQRIVDLLTDLYDKYMKSGLTPEGAFVDSMRGKDGEFFSGLKASYIKGIRNASENLKARRENGAAVKTGAQEKTDTAQKKADTARKKADTVQEKTDTVQKKADTVQKKADTVQKKTDTPVTADLTDEQKRVQSLLEDDSLSRRARADELYSVIMADENTIIKPQEAHSGDISPESGSLMFSIKERENIEVRSRKYYQKHRAQSAHVSETMFETANDIIDEMARYMEPFLDITNNKGKRYLPEEILGKTSFDNGSYGKTIENTTICFRTLAYIDFTNEIKKRIGRPLTVEESFLASQMLYDIAKEPQCLYCYVSLDRKAYDGFLLVYTKQRDAAMAKYAEAGIDPSERLKPQATKKTDRGDSRYKLGDSTLEKLYREYLHGREDTPNQRERFNMWLDAANSAEGFITNADLTTEEKRSEIKNLDNSLSKQVIDAEEYAQDASWAKKLEQYRSYNSDILSMPRPTVEKLNRQYGLRFYSFSEYTPAFIVENMQQIRDASIKGLYGLGYTKKPDFARIFANTGMNINISVFGRMDNGKVVPDTLQGADWNEVQELRKYRNVGAVFVATNDAMVDWALAQDWIDVVIPFHIVRTGANVAEFYNWVNYTKDQADVDEKGKNRTITPAEFHNDYDTYMKLIKERGLTPRFAKWIDNPNYMKLVNETRLSDLESAKLTPNFTKEALEIAKKSFNTFVEDGGYYGDWYKDDKGYEDSVNTVVNDVLSGKKANEVDYGRQDIDVSTAMEMRKNRQHGQSLMSKSTRDNSSAQETGGVVHQTREENDSATVKAVDTEGVTEAETALENAMLPEPGLYDTEAFKSFEAKYDKANGEGAARELIRSSKQMERQLKRLEAKLKAKTDAAEYEKAKAYWEATLKENAENEARKEARKRVDDVWRKRDEHNVNQAKWEGRMNTLEAEARGILAKNKALEAQRSKYEERMARMREAADRRRKLEVQRTAWTGRFRMSDALHRQRVLNSREARQDMTDIRKGRKLPDGDPSNGLVRVDLSYDNPEDRTAAQKINDTADGLKSWAAKAYRELVNKIQGIDNFGARQARLGMDVTTLDVLAKSAAVCKGTVMSIFKTGLVDRKGNRIGAAMKDVFLMWNPDGTVDQQSTDILQQYLIHMHNIDRMSFETRAQERLRAFEAEHPELTALSAAQLAYLVADTREAELLQGIMDYHEPRMMAAQTQEDVDTEFAEMERRMHEVSADFQLNHLAQMYMELISERANAKNKAVIADVNGKPVSAETSTAIAEDLRKRFDWLDARANAIYDWYDRFMRAWVVGDSVSQTDYARMREVYPHYIPTYRVKKGMKLSTLTTFGKDIGAGRAVHSLSENGSVEQLILPVDSFANLIASNVKRSRMNQAIRSVYETALADEDGEFLDTAQVLVDSEGDRRSIDEVLASMADDNIESKNGAYMLSAWYDGERRRVVVNKDLFDSFSALANISRTEDGAFTKAVRTFTDVQKAFITGYNPFFGLRNIFRDLPTAFINSASGLRYGQYWFRAWREITQQSDNWQHFVALGGEQMGYYENERGVDRNTGAFIRQMDKRTGAKGAWDATLNFLGWFNNTTESVTRFGEYLATIDRLGDNVNGRLQGIKNAAEVTVDFSRSGKAGQKINAWVPYWNPAVQGVDKVIRSVYNDGELKKAWTTLGRAAVVSILPEALLLAILSALDRRDDWEELSDYVRDNYYCIPLPGEKRFLKIAKNREWAALLGTPLMRCVQWLDGREDPWHNYAEINIGGNFLPDGVEGIAGYSWYHDLKTNENFAGSPIEGGEFRDYTSGARASAKNIYTDDTTVFAYALSRATSLFENGLSAVQIDYIINDYFGDFASMFIGLFNLGLFSGEYTLNAELSDIASQLGKSWVADSRYSNLALSNYYDTLDALGSDIADAKLTDPEGYTGGVAYKTRQALNIYSKQISALGKQAKSMADGEEKAAVKAEMAGYAQEAVDIYRKAMSGELDEPYLYVKYADYGDSIRDEMIALADYAEEYNYEPAISVQKQYTDPKRKGYAYVLTDEQKQQYTDTFKAYYIDTANRMIQSSSYQASTGEGKAELLEGARAEALEKAKAEFMSWLAKNATSTPKEK